MAISKVNIDLGSRSYPIHIGSGLLDRRDLLDRAIGGHQVLIVTNDVVAPIYLARLQAVLGDQRQINTIVLPDGEQHKDLAHWQLVIDRLVSMGAMRDVVLVALGGGVVGDLTGFAAASYMRGVDFVQIPTTLLAQVDAAVGGKTAINHPQGKNLVGAFHQPCAVLIDTNTLQSLPEREYRAGIAEVLKYGLIRDAQFFVWLCDKRDELLARDGETLRQAIERSCQHKAEVVAADEREGGVRALLNLGHTFGHAIETASGYGRVLHGEAVAIGTCLAADLSVRLGQLSAEDAKTIAVTVEQFGLPSTIPTGPNGPLDAQQLVDLMRLDKKNRARQIRLILLQSIGEAVVQNAPDPSLLLEVIAARTEAIQVGREASRSAPST